MTPEERARVAALDPATRAALRRQAAARQAQGHPEIRLTFRDDTVITATPAEWLAALEDPNG